MFENLLQNTLYLKNLIFAHFLELQHSRWLFAWPQNYKKLGRELISDVISEIRFKKTLYFMHNLVKSIEILLHYTRDIMCREYSKTSICVGNSMISSAVGKTRTSELFKNHENWSLSTTQECFFFELLFLINKMMKKFIYSADF